jgi:hypothetical protein
MVNIYLNIEDRQVLALSIPFSDIERLSLRPVKWLRYVTFAVCGAHGDLSATPNGPPVKYDSISLAGPIAESYYYTFQGKSIFTDLKLVARRQYLVFMPGDHHLIDHNAMNDRMTSSVKTLRSSRFRDEVMARDGSRCVFTRADGDICDAAHIIPKSKGDEVSSFIASSYCLTKSTLSTSL